MLIPVGVVVMVGGGLYQLLITWPEGERTKNKWVLILGDKGNDIVQETTKNNIHFNKWRNKLNDHNSFAQTHRASKNILNNPEIQVL